VQNREPAGRHAGHRLMAEPKGLVQRLDFERFPAGRFNAPKPLSIASEND